MPAGLRRWLWRGLWALLAAAGVFGVGVLVGAPVAWPFDVAVNLAPAVVAPELRAPADGKVRLVVLQHGLFRTAASLGRLERTLQQHGYEVLNCGYPSTRGRIEEFAERLHAAIEARFAAGRVDEVAFVGHSLGGLVIEEYLRRTDARVPVACVYLGTPHRGAVLADRRRHWFLFRLAMGRGAAFQLATTDPIHTRPIPYGERSGTVVGDLGPGNASIPGDDDGTVGVAEATFAGASASLIVPFGHTRLTFAAPVLRQVLHFLSRRTFAPDTQLR